MLAPLYVRIMCKDRQNGCEMQKAHPRKRVRRKKARRKRRKVRRKRRNLQRSGQECFFKL